MVFDYLKTRATAVRLIEKFGQTATLTQTANSGTAYNPTRTETDHTCTLAVLDYRDRDIDGTLIKAGDKQVYISTDGLSVSPDKGDKITIGGTDHEIVQVMPLSPAGTVVYWKAQVRE